MILWCFTLALQKDLETLAEIVGANSTAALSFGDQSAAAELLSGLRAKQHLRVARIYSAEGKLFASYQRPDVRQSTPRSCRSKPAAVNLRGTACSFFIPLC